MTQSKHTPAPWRIEQLDKEKPNCFHIVANTGYDAPDYIATCGKNDAHLIAAAPEMLEALNMALEFLPEGGDPHNAAQAAIAKARGIK